MKRLRGDNPGFHILSPSSVDQNQDKVVFLINSARDKFEVIHDFEHLTQILSKENTLNNCTEEMFEKIVSIITGVLSMGEVATSVLTLNVSMF
jgi:hypothetical protein